MHLDANTQAGEQMFVWTVRSYRIQEHCLCYKHNSPFILFTLYDEKEKHLNSEPMAENLCCHECMKSPLNVKYCHSYQLVIVVQAL